MVGDCVIGDGDYTRAAPPGLEQLTIRCGGLAVSEDKRGKKAEAGDAKVHRRCRPTPPRAAAARADATD